MHRIKKLLGILFILGIVFFIICDEKGYKIGFENNHIIFNKSGEKSDSVVIRETTNNLKASEKNVVYKNSDLVHLNYEFKNPKILRKSGGMNPEYLAKIEEEKRLEKEKIEEEKLKNQEKVYTGPNIISLDDGTISSVFQPRDSGSDESLEDKENEYGETGMNEQEVEENILYKNSKRVKIYPGFEKPLNMRKGVVIFNVGSSEDGILYKNSKRVKIYSGFENPLNMRKAVGSLNTISPEDGILYKNSKRVKIYSGFESPLNMRKAVETIQEKLVDEKQEEKSDYQLIVKPEGENVTESGNGMESLEKDEIEDVVYEVEKYEREHKDYSLNLNKGKEVEETLIPVDKPEISNHQLSISEGKLPETVLIAVSKYKLNKHVLNLKMGKSIKHDFVVENQNNSSTIDGGLSDSLLDTLLVNEDIDIDTLESENDEFLQKVFDETRDRDVMNLIVETYLNEYQFVKAKRFIENLPEMYRNELKPSLNLRVAFNSFALSSKNVVENLNSLLQDYSSKGIILDEDKNRYLCVLALMDRNYDKFFEIAAGFKSDKNKAFASKLQGYKDQIAKQMGMPDYYFDTLVSLELFNQGLFQPAKVLALYSLQQNSNYILPYQILAYANFLTNSRDTSIEYLKKLIDIDPNNAEKYRFLMGIAYYRDEKYQQSVIMLSLIKDDKLRLDAERYLIRDYVHLDQKNKLISIWNKILGYDDLVASDFYTYFYEAFYHPFSEGADYQIFALDSELANKMIRVCSMKLSEEEKVVCNYGMIGRNIALGQFDGLEESLLKLSAEYPQGYLYQALGQYYIHQGNTEKAKAYLLKAVSMTKKVPEIVQIKKLLQDTM